MRHELPPPTGAPIETDAPPVDDRRGTGVTVGLVAASVACGLLAALVVGGSIGYVVASASAGDCSPGDGWCGLGAALAGMFAALLTGAIAYAAAGIALIRRRRPAGDRAAAIVAHLAVPPLLVTVLSVLSTLSGAL